MDTVLFWKEQHPWFTELATPTSMYGAEVGGWISEGISVAIMDHDSDAGHAAHNSAVVLSLLVASLGILGAWFLYVRRRDLPAKITGVLGAVYVTVRHRYYVDEGIKATFIRGTMALAAVQKWFDEHVIDGLVNFVGHANRTGGAFSAWFDRIFVDGAVNGIALVSQSFGAVLRLMQTGRIQQYAGFAVGGSLLAAAWLILA